MITRRARGIENANTSDKLTKQNKYEKQALRGGCENKGGIQKTLGIDGKEYR